ncbi:unnamed protein product [Nesidiocoris tenuis]|uniref:Uncharacterized protein n=1 Tax=Nesidiocoris tenuis TaxID=355587 RepID=A0A6H5G394_9HEMI|nr:unnamed protein product [Nesidiocoris tenuis]
MREVIRRKEPTYQSTVIRCSTRRSISLTILSQLDFPRLKAVVLWRGRPAATGCDWLFGKQKTDERNAEGVKNETRPEEQVAPEERKASSAKDFQLTTKGRQRCIGSGTENWIGLSVTAATRVEKSQKEAGMRAKGLGTTTITRIWLNAHGQTRKLVKVDRWRWTVGCEWHPHQTFDVDEALERIASVVADYEYHGRCYERSTIRNGKQLAPWSAKEGGIICAVRRRVRCYHANGSWDDSNRDAITMASTFDYEFELHCEYDFEFDYEFEFLFHCEYVFEIDHEFDFDCDLIDDHNTSIYSVNMEVKTQIKAKFVYGRGSLCNHCGHCGPSRGGLAFYTVDQHPQTSLYVPVGASRELLPVFGQDPIVSRRALNLII